MSHVVRYHSGGEDVVDDVDTLADALAALRALHEAGNTSGKVYREVPVRVETTVTVSVDDESVPVPAEVPPPPVFSESVDAPAETREPEGERRRRVASVDFVAPTA